MAKLRVGFIGTGKKPEKAGLMGYAMAYRHAVGYKLLPDCEITACADNEMKAMEIVFGCYESSRRRGRVDLPMDITDSPLIAMLESGDLKPAEDA